MTNDTTPTDDTTEASTADADVTFADLGLPVELLRQLDALGYEEPTAIQRDAIPPLLEGRDVLGQAATGTGKTAAFTLPMLARLHARDRAGEPIAEPYGLVVVPTRELAMQVSQAVHTYGQALGVRVLPVYGGQPISRQIRRLEKGVDVVVATPGRCVDHLSRGTLRLGDVGVVVLDEADEMLDMGFAEDLDTILDAAASERQTALFSATMPRRLVSIAEKRMTDPLRVTIDRADQTDSETPDIREQVVVVKRHHKEAAITRVLDVEDPTATIIFCRTRKDVEDLASTMAGRGRDVRALHGGMDQPARQRVLDELRSGAAEVVVATDVAARGLDVDRLTHVVNHSLPTQPEQYVHRIGRVGRAGRAGVAITLAEPRETKALRAIERHVGRKLDVTPVPTVEELRERRRQQLVDRVREAMQRADLPAGLKAFDELGDADDAVSIAVAALQVLHDDASGDHDEMHVPQFDLQPEHGKGGSKGGGKGGRSKSGSSDGGGRASYAHADGDTESVWLSVGRNVGIRPKDIVGAVCGETSLKGRDIGNISIMGRFSLVEVPAASADEVVEKMSRATVRNKKVHAKRDQR